MEFQKVEDGFYRGQSADYVVELVRAKPAMWAATISEKGTLVGVLPHCKTWHIAGALAARWIRQYNAEKGLDPHELALRRAMAGML